MALDKEKTIELIGDTISKFEHIRQYRKVKYLDEDFHVADATMKYIFKEVLSPEEIFKAEAGLNAHTKGMINSKNPMMYFCEYCNFAIANLRICEIKLRHFSSDSSGSAEKVSATKEIQHAENQWVVANASSQIGSKAMKLKKRLRESVDSKVRMFGFTIDLKKLFRKTNVNR